MVSVSGEGPTPPDVGLISQSRQSLPVAVWLTRIPSPVQLRNACVAESLGSSARRRSLGFCLLCEVTPSAQRGRSLSGQTSRSTLGPWQSRCGITLPPCVGQRKKVTVPSRPDATRSTAAIFFEGQKSGIKKKRGERGQTPSLFMVLLAIPFFFKKLNSPHLIF